MPLILRSSTIIPLTNDQMDGNWLTLQQQILTLQVTVGALSSGTVYVLPTASTSILGGVKVDGTTINITNGIISTPPLPIASTLVLGGIKIGTGVSIDGAGVLSVPAYTLPTASTTVLGGVKIDGASIIITSGVISAVGNSYTLPTASISVLGGVKVGSGLVINGSGVLSTVVSGVTSYNGLTGDVSGVTTFNGANGAVTGVSSFNGASGTILGVSSFNGATGVVTGVSSFNSATGAITGVSSIDGATGVVTGIPTLASNNVFTGLNGFGGANPWVGNTIAYSTAPVPSAIGYGSYTPGATSQAFATCVDQTTSVHLACYYGIPSSTPTYLGGITTTASTIAFVSVSDRRLKTNITPLTNASDIINQIKPVNYNWVASPLDRSTIGFIADEVQAIVPQAVFGVAGAVDDNNNPKYQTVNQTYLIPLLTASLQEALARIAILETKVAALQPIVV